MWLFLPALTVDNSLELADEEECLKMGQKDVSVIMQ